MTRTKKQVILAAICSVIYTTLPHTALDAVQGSITEQSVDVIVNAANPQLQGGGGVCGGIFKAAGWAALQAACNKFPLIKGVRCAVGDARITDSFGLKKIGVQKIIHAVGPDARIIKDQTQQRTLLEAAYTASLELASQNKFKTIAFPFISSGIYAVDHTLAAEAAITAARNFVNSQRTSLTEIRFVLLYQDDFDLFNQLLNQP